MASTVWITTLLAALQTGAQDWPRFRGPDWAGISDATTIPVTWTAQDYNWKVKLPGEGHSSPAVVGERIYLTCADLETAGKECFLPIGLHTVSEDDHAATVACLRAAPFIPSPICKLKDRLVP